MRHCEKQESTLQSRGGHRLGLLASNVAMNYLVTGVELVIGVLLLPFNVTHLGQSAYGLWVLTASITTYFSVLDLGYGLAQVKFIAQYQARRDKEAMNQIASTMFLLFTAVGLVTYAVAVLLAFNLDKLFNVTPSQMSTGRVVLLIISAYFAMGFPCSVFGGIVNGFQRRYLNGIVGIATSIVVAVVNVGVLLAGYGLVELVAATTAVRMLSYIGYCLNAYRVFPGLRINPKYFRLARLREITGFSAFMLLIDLANKLNYSTDTIVIGAFISTTAVAIWAVSQRLIDIIQRLTDQLNGALFPVIVDSATIGHGDRLRIVLLQGTRLSLAMVIPAAAGLAFIAQPLILAWVGPKFVDSVHITYVLAVAVAIRVGNATATTLLKGAGGHRLLAASNVSIAVMNVILSIILVQSYGIIGVAFGTLIPLGAVSIFILFPASCRRVGLPVRHALANAVWPTIWPAIISAVVLVVTNNMAGSGLASTAARGIVAGLLYVFLFLRFAISNEDRSWYITKLGQLLGYPVSRLEPMNLKGGR